MPILKVISSDELHKEISLHGYSIKELSKKVGVTEQYLSSVVRGNRSPSPPLAKRISNVLNSNVKDFFL